MAHNLSSFITENFVPILGAWEKRAVDLMGANVSATDARDHAEGMLLAIIADMQEKQSPEKQSDKSQGLGPQNESGQAELHGHQRQQAGFSLPETLSEFRALRATVLRLWNESSATAMQSDVDGIIRFNEVVDKLLAQLVARYASDKDKELRDATTLSDTIIESAPEGFFMIDAELKLVRWSQYFREETGLSDEMLMGKSILNFIMENDRPMAAAKFLSAFAMGSTTVDVRWPTIHGLRLYVRTARLFENKGFQYLSCFGMDVTERRRAEEALTNEKRFFAAMYRIVNSNAGRC